jgi:hypothetical protein
MTFRAVTLLAICLLLVDVYAPPMHAQDARSDAVVWAGLSRTAFRTTFHLAIERRRHL